MVSLARVGPVSLIRRGKFEPPEAPSQEDGWGFSPYSIFEASTKDQEHLDPYLFVWLHGADGGSELPTTDMATMHRHIGHRVFFLVPQSPKPSFGGYRFYWGVRYTKAQNKNGFGFIFGDICDEYLDVFTQVVRELAVEVGACRTIIAGYSMGGFGAYHIGGHAPDVFDAVISFAGYGIGTTEPVDNGASVPQPEATMIFQRFLARFAPQLAKVPLVMAVHAPDDTVSSFKDTKMIIETVKSFKGNTVIIPVPSELSDSDASRKKKTKLGHHYWSASLLSPETSDMLFYNRFKAEMAKLKPRRGSRLKPSAKPPIKPTAASQSWQSRNSPAQAQAKAEESDWRKKPGTMASYSTVQVKPHVQGPSKPHVQGPGKAASTVQSKIAKAASTGSSNGLRGRLAASNGQDPPKLCCPADHELKETLAPVAGYGCDICKRTLGLNAKIHGCRQCDYDLCHACALQLRAEYAGEKMQAQKEADAKLQADADSSGSNGSPKEYSNVLDPSKSVLGKRLSTPMEVTPAKRLCSSSAASSNSTSNAAKVTGGATQIKEASIVGRPAGASKGISISPASSPHAIKKPDATSGINSSASKFDLSKINLTTPIVKPSAAQRPPSAAQTSAALPSKPLAKTNPGQLRGTLLARGSSTSSLQGRAPVPSSSSQLRMKW